MSANTTLCLSASTRSSSSRTETGTLAARISLNKPSSMCTSNSDDSVIAAVLGIGVVDAVPVGLGGDEDMLLRYLAQGGVQGADSHAQFIFAIVDELQRGTALRAEGACHRLGGWVSADPILALKQVKRRPRHAGITGKCRAMSRAAHAAVTVAHLANGRIDAVFHRAAQTAVGMHCQSSSLRPSAVGATAHE